MPPRTFKRQDFSALAFAAFATLFTSLMGPIEQPRAPVEAGDPALDGLIDAHTARETGGWLIDEQDPADVRLNFAPEYDRLVWRVTGTNDTDVLLDAKTGEALGFEFR